MARLIVAGFEDWAPNKSGGLHINPARLAIMRIEAERSALAYELSRATNGRVDSVETRILPAAPVVDGKFETLRDFERISTALREKVLKILQPTDLFIGFGQGGYSVPTFSIESHFFNQYVSPGVDQKEVVFETPNKPEFSIGLGHELTPERVESIVRLAPNLSGHVVAASNPGKFNCNYVGRMMFDYLEAKSIFVHLPFCVDSLQAESLFHRNPEKLFGMGIKKPDQIAIFRPDLVPEFVVSSVVTMAA